MLEDKSKTGEDIKEDIISEGRLYILSIRIAFRLLQMSLCHQETQGLRLTSIFDRVEKEPKRAGESFIS